MSKTRLASSSLSLGLACSTLLGCLGASPDVRDGAEQDESVTADETEFQVDLGDNSQPLNGTVTFPDTSCDSSDNRYKNAAKAATLLAYQSLNKWELHNCLQNAFFAMSGHAPEIVIDKMRQNLPTEIKCGHLGSALGRAPTNVSNETLTIDYDVLDGSTEGTASVILHEIAHNKGYTHQDDPNNSSTLKYFHTVEYSHTVPEQLQRCFETMFAGQSPALPNGRRRDALKDATTLAGVGGMGGNPFHIPCGIGVGLQVRSGSAINAIGPVCMSLVGGGGGTMAGGADGALSTMTCSGAEFLVGVQGRTDASKLVAVGAICENSNSVIEKRRAPEDVRRVGWKGGSTGVGFERWCPKGMVMTALKGRSGDLVDRLELECVSIDGYDVPEQTKLSWAGGSGGVLQLEKCAGNAALEGLTLQADTRVKRLGGTCAEVTTNCVSGVCTESIGSARHWLQAQGGTSGQVAQQRCAGGSAIVGLQLRTGSLVDAVGGVCANVAAWSGTGSAPTTNLGLVGGTGGTATTRTCPRGTFMTGWEMRSGSAVDAVRPICREFR